MTRLHTTADLPRVHAADHPDRTALVFEERSSTWSELDRRTNRVAQALLATGLAPQARVAYLGKNSNCFTEVQLAVAKSRHVLVPVNWRLTVAEMSFILDDAEAEVLFVGVDYLPLLPALRAAAPRLKLAISVDGPHEGARAYEDWIAAQSDVDPDLPADPDEVVIQLYTSGTTGLPKGAELTHRQVLSANSRAATGQLGPWKNTDVCMTVLPQFHAGGACYSMNAVYMGATLVLVREPQPELIMQTMARHRVTKTSMVPAVLQFVLDHPTFDARHFASVDTICYGGAPITPALLRRALAAVGPVFLQMFGMTETDCIATVLPHEDHDPDRPQVLASCGRVLPGVELRIVRLDGTTADTGEAGEIWIRCGSVMKGYWHRPEANAAVLTDGWYHTGDIGSLDAEGYLSIHDRLKDMIISGGENVYPAEVERVLAEHPAVADVGVIGVPDERWGEAVKAVVVLRPGTQVTASDLLAFARKSLAGYKCPKSIDFIEALPRNPSGKILKRVLREPYWKGHTRRVN